MAPGAYGCFSKDHWLRVSSIAGQRNYTVVCHPWTSTCYTINLCTKFEVSIPTHYADTKGIQNSENWVVWGS